MQWVATPMPCSTVTRHSDASPSTTMRCTASTPLRCPRQPAAIAALPSLSSHAVLTPAASPAPCSRCVVKVKGATRAACAFPAFPERACMRADLAPTAQKASSRAFLCGTSDPTTHTHAPTAQCNCHPCMAACSCHMQQQNPFPRHQPCQTCTQVLYCPCWCCCAFICHGLTAHQMPSAPPRES